ncbi:MAG: hypothetical protein E7037_08670 [Verrucomicrobia bacterium]|nr:hypothetical protein [Verrucomicrobiota bacterium]
MKAVINLFPIRPLPTFENLSEELYAEISTIVGKEYTSVSSSVFRNYSLFFFLPENAFVYYFPALILATRKNFDDCRFCIEYTIDLFVSDAEFQHRWKKFSLKQRYFIADWIDSIRARFRDSETDDVFIVAIDILRGDDRYWLS